MTADDITRRHHTAPRVYLRGFAEGERVSIRARSGVERDYVHVSDVTVRKNFYNFRTSEGVETSAVERWLDRGVESPVGRILDRLVGGQAVTEADHPALARFVVSQLLRTPATAAMLNHFDGHIGPLLVVQAVLTRHDLDPTTMPQQQLDELTQEATKAWRARGGDNQRRSHLRTIMRKIDELAGQLADWSWLVLDAPEPRLITSDAPVATYHDPGRAWGGIVPPGSAVYLPLSPRHLLVGERHTIVSSTVLRAELADLVNQATARQATDVILKSPTQPWPTDLTFLPSPPPLPDPQITWRRSGGPSTVPARFPDVLSPDIRAVLDELEATDVVT